MSEPGVALDLEDFRRLGVRPNETRTSVIRAAATRSSKPLADEHLRTAGEQVEVQLARVVTSTYRLLNPRHRDSGSARTQVGRILPLALRLAGQTRFGDSSLHSSLDEAFQRTAPTQPADEFDDWRGFDPPARYADPAQWMEEQSAASDGPTSGPAGDKLPLQGEKRFLHVRWTPRRRAIGMVATAAIAVTTIVLVSVLSSSPSNPTVAASYEPPQPDSPANAWDTTDFQTLPLEFADSRDLKKLPVVDRLGELQFTSNDLAPIDPPRLELPIPNVPVEPTDDAFFERPSEDSVRQARLSLQMRFPELRRLALPSQVSQQIQILKQAEASFDRGSAEDWTCQFLIAELSWLIDESAVLRPRLESIAAQYGQPVDRMIADTFESACRLASLPKTHEHLIQSGMSLADELLVNECFDASRRIVRALVSSVESLDENESRVQIDKLTAAIDQAEHLSTIAERTQADEPSVESSVSSSTGPNWGVTGRYYCLYLRRWDVGLTWLPEAADSRIASAARRELGLESPATVEETREIADLWLALASRAEGRIADSMRMHAIELLESLVPGSSGLEKLKLRRQIQAESSRLPSYLTQTLVTG